MSRPDDWTDGLQAKIPLRKVEEIAGPLMDSLLTGAIGSIEGAVFMDDATRFKLMCEIEKTLAPFIKPLLQKAKAVAERPDKIGVFDRSAEALIKATDNKVHRTILESAKSDIIKTAVCYAIKESIEAYLKAQIVDLADMAVADAVMAEIIRAGKIPPDPQVLKVVEALKSLSPDEPAHWNDAGFPMIEAVEMISGVVGVSRRDIDKAMPGWNLARARAQAVASI